MVADIFHHNHKCCQSSTFLYEHAVHTHSFLNLCCFTIDVGHQDCLTVATCKKTYESQFKETPQPDSNTTRPNETEWFEKGAHPKSLWEREWVCSVGKAHVPYAGQLMPIWPAPGRTGTCWYTWPPSAPDLQTRQREKHRTENSEVWEKSVGAWNRKKTY